MDVVDAQRDVVQAGASLLDVLRDRRSGAVASSSSSLDCPDRHEVRAHALRRHLFGRLDLEAERVAIERQRRGQVLHGDADVVQDGFHVAADHHEGTKGTKTHEYVQCNSALGSG